MDFTVTNKKQLTLLGQVFIASCFITLYVSHGNMLGLATQAPVILNIYEKYNSLLGDK